MLEETLAQIVSELVVTQADKVVEGYLEDGICHARVLALNQSLQERLAQATTKSEGTSMGVKGTGSLI